MTRWPAAVAVSVFAHAAVAGGLLVLLGRSSTTPLSSAAPHTRAVEVMRIGVLPRTAHSGEPVGAPAPPARAGRGTAAAPRPLTVDAPAPSQVVLVEPGPTAMETLDVPSAGAEPASGSNTIRVEASTGTAAPSAGTPSLSGSNTTGGEGSTGTATTPTVAQAGADDARGDPVDLAFTRELHARLAAAASECYPPQARRFRQQARVPVSFCIDADGQPERVVVTPSGIASLDDAASSCVVRRAAPYPLRARAHCFTVPIDFGARGD